MRRNENQSTGTVFGCVGQVALLFIVWFSPSELKLLKTRLPATCENTAYKRTVPK